MEKLLVLLLFIIVIYLLFFQPCLEFFNVCVSKEYRRNGIARGIFNYVFSYAKENGYNQIFLTCLDSAYSVHNLYESLDFKRMSSVKCSVNL